MAAQHAESVPWNHYEAVIKELEDERIAHADTKSQLMDTQDKLAFATGEIEILRKQIEREKMQFEKTFGVMKSKALTETMKTAELENKCEKIEQQREQQSGTLSSRDQEVATLTQKLQQTQAEYEHQLEEVNIQKQQELYIANMMSEREQRGHGVGQANKTTDARNEDFQYKPEANYDEATMAQQRAIEKQIMETQHLIGNREELSGLLQEYATDDAVYQHKIQDLSSRYIYLRRTRGDGNCFFRGFGFAYLESLLQNKEELDRFKGIAAKSKDDLVNLGFPQFTIEDFHDVFMEVLEKVSAQCSLDDLLDVFNDQGYSDYLVVYFRLLVSGHLQKEADFFMSFVEGGRTMKEFCNQEVEPMGKESDHIHIIALAAAIDVPVRVEYMDRGNTGTVNHHDFPDGSHPHIQLLYRPGHYDILYGNK